MRKQIVIVFSLVLVHAIIATGQERTTRPASQPSPSEPRAEVLVLGTYHMANPGRDIFNTQADDVLAPKRQAEIAQLVEVLKRFRPTKIAVESSVWNKRIAEDYANYVAGKRELTRNETEQIGFRLAKELGHKAIYPVDADGDFPYPRLVNHAKATGRSEELEATMAEVGVKVEEQNKYLASHTILETLLYMNADERVAEDGGFYYRMAHFSEPGDWAGPDLASEWFRRNMRIYGNIVGLVDSPNERVLVIYGAGHLSWLHHNVSSDPTLRLRKLAEFVE